MNGSADIRPLMDDEKILVLGEENRENVSPSSNAVSTYKQWPYLGILLATASSVFFSLCSVIVKWMSTVDPVELAIFRFIGVLLPTLPILVSSKVQIIDVFPKGKRLLLLLRSFVGTTGLMLSFYAFRHMPLGDASVIVFSVPVFVAIFARIFLKEPIGLFNIVTIGLTLIGVTLIAKPTFLFSQNIGKQSIETMSAIAAFSSTLFGASALVLLRALKCLHFSVVMSNFGIFAILETVLVSWYFGKLCIPACGIDRILVIMLGLFSFLGQILLTLAFQVENAGPISVARSSDIVFAFVWQIVFFNEMPSTLSVIGAILVISSVLLIGVRKWVLTLPQEQRINRRLHIFVI